MKTMIAYASKSGATKECAGLINQKLHMCNIFDISKEAPSIDGFDTVIIGSGVRMGKLYKPVLTFIKKNEEILLSKRIAFYLCNAYPDTFQKAVEKNIPQKLIQAAVSVMSFGGKPPFTSSSSSDWLISTNVTAFMQMLRA
ncbi:MAG: flavodoxin domain-containing protein [Lachnospiraceae bacterium]